MTHTTYCCFRPDCQDEHCPGVEIARLHEKEGGVTVSGPLVFPLTVDRDETMPAKFRTERAPDPIVFGLVAVMRFAPIVFVVMALATFFLLDVWKGKP